MTVFLLKTQIKGYAKQDGTYVSPHDDKRSAAKARASKKPIGGKEKRNVTATKEFHDWFGKSKVVDDAGKPLVVYHGTASDFSEFDMNLGGAVWGTSDSEGVMWFAGNIWRANAGARDAANVNAETDEHYDAQTGSNVRPVYLSMQKPRHVSASDALDPAELADIIKQAKENGHDGIILSPGEMGGTDYAVFRPEQIKSAIGNRGTFDSNSADITKASRAYALFLKAPTAASASPAQLKAGNYKKRHIRIYGLDVSIENPAGSVRSGVDRDGHEWQTKMVCDYGYIKGSMGVDKDHVDCYIGPDKESDTVYVVHQRKAGRWDQYDEDKVMLGFKSEAEAKAAYLKHYDNPKFLGPVTAMPVDEFRRKVLETKDKPKMIKNFPSVVIGGNALESTPDSVDTAPAMTVICLDFDGVLHNHHGLPWAGEADIQGPPIPGAKEAVAFLRTKYHVLVNSARCRTPEGMQAVFDYLIGNGIHVDGVTEHKPAAAAYVDDLGVPFTGNWSAVIAALAEKNHEGVVL